MIQEVNTRNTKDKLPNIDSILRSLTSPILLCSKYNTKRDCLLFIYHDLHTSY